MQARWDLNLNCSDSTPKILKLCGKKWGLQLCILTLLTPISTIMGNVLSQQETDIFGTYCLIMHLIWWGLNNSFLSIIIYWVPYDLLHNMKLHSRIALMISSTFSFQNYIFSCVNWNRNIECVGTVSHVFWVSRCE